MVENGRKIYLVFVPFEMPLPAHHRESETMA